MDENYTSKFKKGRDQQSTLARMLLNRFQALTWEVAVTPGAIPEKCG
jgi:hypothetical protein